MAILGATLLRCRVGTPVTIQVRLADPWGALLGADDERAVWQMAGSMNERLGYLR